ncbi:MAG: gliding motility-associated C-terminal domain-containing protein [Chitinophagales bacterium]
MQTKLLLLLCGMVIIQISSAQYNLVPNPSFEVYNACPVSISGFEFATDNYCDDWYAGSGGTPDYYNACAGPGSMVSVPDNLFSDDQPARTGDAYGGFWTDLYDNNSFIYREYVQRKLATPLVAGECYYVEFWSAPATQSDFAGSDHATTDAIGAYFSTVKVGDAFGSEVLPYTPQIDNNGSGNYISTPGDWTKICGFFEAEGGEEWVCIGNFHGDDEVTVVAYDGGVLVASPLVYLFIEDVLVSPIDSMLYLPDTVVCSPLVLTAPTCANSYLWSTGETTNEITVYSTGDYWLQMETGCGIVNDTASILFVEDSVYTSAETTQICFTELPFTLNASPSYDAYLWSTGATTDNIVVTESGTYYVQGYADCATFIDSFIVDVIEPIGLFPELGDDQLICDATWEIVLTVPSGFESYEWSTGETDESITVSSAGTYSITVESACETFSDEVTFTEDPYLNATIELGEDLVLCPPGGIETLLIDAGGSLPNYTWSTGETTSAITVDAPGTYFVSSDLLCNDPSDTIRITYCEDIAVPNSFSPNGDGYNDNVYVIVIDPNRVISFLIYNRWGQLVFDGNASNLSWDGTFEGEDQPLGSYVYVLNYLSTTGENLSMQGNITLVR